MLEVLLILLGMIVLGLLWKMLYDSTHFQTTEYLVSDPRINKTYRAVVLSDLHNTRYGRKNQVLLQKIRQLEPDMILIAGDMLTAKPKADPGPALELLRALALAYPVYYGNGNHEHRIKLYPEVYGELAKRYEKGLQEAGIHPLINEGRDLPEGGIRIVGCEIDRQYYKRFHKTPMEEEYLRELLGEPDPDRFTILLAHNPDYFPEYADWGADLVLSGHVHGGVVRIPFLDKGVISPAIRLFPRYDGGGFCEKKSCMIVSRGLGCHTIPFRLFNPGDLILLELSRGPVRETKKRTRKSR